MQMDYERSMSQPAVEMNEGIFLQINGIKEGPYSQIDLKGRIESGTLSKTTLAWHEGLSNWMPVLAVITPRTPPPAFKNQDNHKIEVPIIPNEPSVSKSVESFESSRAKPNETILRIINQTKQIGWRKSFLLLPSMQISHGIYSGCGGLVGF